MATFKRNYVLLLVALFFSPMLNVGSLFELAKEVSNNNNLELSCILMPDNGAFFVNRQEALVNVLRCSK